MKKLFLILLFTISCFANEYGITVGANIGLGMPMDALEYDYYNEFESGFSEIGFGIRPAITLGDDNKFAIGLDYNLRYQKYTYNRRSTRIKTDYWSSVVDNSPIAYTYEEEYSVKETITSLTHNIGFSFCEKLTKNPNWWSFGYDVESNGPYASANIGFFNGPDNYNSNFMMAFSAYISTKKMSIGLTLNFQSYTDYYSEKHNYSSYSPTYYLNSYETNSSYTNDSTYYSSDTTYYGGTGRVYVSGHLRHYKSGKITYVRPHTRSYPRRK